jgi:catechol 2,3-dioxygenase-like lactoylglutathione lyase family enzyme
MLDQIGFAVADFTRSRDFYAKALAPLGYEMVIEASPEETGGDASAGFGPGGKVVFWISPGIAPKGNLRVAFAAPDRAAVDAFYQAAIAAGGLANGAPSIRAYHHPDYYAAFVLDPDGHNIEAVCHRAA